MIDTVRLIFDEGTFVILEPDRFQPSAKSILDIEKRIVSRGLMKAVLNPSKQEKDVGLYGPRLTLRRRPPKITDLVIEFSVPKLLYGNNFDEVSEADFKKVIDALQERLSRWGVCIFTELLRKAPVGAIHYGKNIVLPRHTLCQSVIRLLSKVPVNQWFDHNRTDFRNGGHLYKVHTNSFELAFYDKVKDLQQSQKGSKRAFEPDSEIQTNLLEYFEVATDIQVLRMEARLNTRTQIQRMQKALNLPDDDLRFFALFSRNIAQKALLHYWEPYQSALPLIVLAQRENPSALISFLLKQDSEASMGSQLQRLGAMTLIGEIGWNGLRSYWQDLERSYYRLKKDLESLQNSDQNPLSDLEAIQATLQAFEPVKMNVVFERYQSWLRIDTEDGSMTL